MIRRANSWRELGGGGEASSFGVPLSPTWNGVGYHPEPPSSGYRETGEQPIFSTKAHVFQIDAGTKKDWLPASKAAVNVSYYYDSTRNTYRIISVDGSKAIVNSTITPNMTFTKTSQKFGQWSDPRANTVYGLGFSSETELSKFIEKFKEIKELTRQAAQLKQGDVNGAVDNHAPSPQMGRQHLHQRTNSLSSIQSDSGNLRERRNSFTQGGSNGHPANAPTEAQLKYENDRLKLALAQSSANAKKWEVELQTLKNNNARLTAALQESTANVEEWKKQLAAYKEESARLKKRLLDQEKGGGGESHMVAQLTDQIERIRLDNHNKQEEIKRLNSQLQEVTARDTQNSTLQARIQALEEENHSLNLRLQDSQRQLQDGRSSRDQEHRELLSLQEALGGRIRDLYEAHETVVATLKKESNS
ncbi:homer protein homolog 2 [Aplysia californica]|uniref:Homer protein homolog 2 n=1 Tax=Aplysia californica TaxID=6500 RepID=A0ABM0JBZ2_APLCA|nr:homer protein homolog 2 [Aplysia californica]